MKIKLVTSLLLAWIALIPLAKAQTPDYPFKKVNTPADIAKYQDSVKGYLEWYVNTPPNKDTALRKDVGAFFIKWIIGTPALKSMMLPTCAMPLVLDENKIYKGDLLYICMSGSAWYKYNNPNDNDDVAIYYAGFIKLLQAIEKYKNLYGDSDTYKKYAAMSEKELKDNIKECLSKQKRRR